MSLSSSSLDYRAFCLHSVPSPRAVRHSWPPRVGVPGALLLPAQKGNHDEEETEQIVTGQQ